MLAVVERVRLGGALLLLAGAASLFAIEMLEHRSEPARPTHGYQCAGSLDRWAPALTLEQAGALADRSYRDGNFEQAECVLRVVADRQLPAKAEELHVVASFYHQLGHSWDIAFDRTDPDSLDHLDWAIQFDSMLGGAFQNQLRAERAERYVMIRK